MNIEYLIQVLENKLNVLGQAKDQAFITGDLERITSVEAEILGVQDTLSKLKLLSDITQAATNTNTTEVDVVAAGVEAVQNPTYVPSDIIVLGEYDISTYATDPLYEQKLNTILSGVGTMNSADAIDQYIQSVNSSSPLTGQMIFEECQKYSVNCCLVVAMLQLESEFGTTGIGANTFNPGNVGNTGTETNTFNSWQEGVGAVADWLNRHRKNSVIPQIQSVLSSIVISPENINIAVDDTQQLTISVLDQNGNAFNGAALAFNSDSTNIATITDWGSITGLSAGAATITVTATSGSEAINKHLVVTVKGPKTKPSKAPVLSNIVVSPSAAVLNISETQQLAIETTDQNGKTFNDAVIAYITDKAEVATVNETGLVTAVSAGVATITATAKSGSEIVSGASTISVNIPAVEVVQPILNSAAIVPSSADIVVGNAQQLTVNILDQNGDVFNGADTVFVSDKVDIATVNETGLVTAVSAGVATITATVTSGSIVVTGNSIVKVSEANTEQPN